MNDLREVKRLAKRIMGEHGVGELPFEFDGALRRLGGLHRRVTDGEPVKLTLSRRYAQVAPLDEVEDTIRHEVAHAITPWAGRWGDAHGPAWVASCAVTGARPRSCTEVSTEVEEQLYRVVYRCSAGCTIRRARRFARGRRYACNAHRLELSLVSR